MRQERGTRDMQGAGQHLPTCQEEGQHLSSLSHYEVPEVFGKNKEEVFVLSKISTFLTCNLGTQTAQHLGTPLGCRKSLSGNTEIQVAHQSCFPPCLLIQVFHLSGNHRQILKLMVGLKSLMRFFFFLNLKAFFISRLSWHANSKNLPSNSLTLLQWMSRQALSNKYHLWFLWHTCFAVKLWR